MLAGVRLVNGTAALVAPSVMARRLGAEADGNKAALYAMRLFGVRTILIGSDLLHSDATVRARALRLAPFVHVSDTVAAVLAGTGRQLPRKAAVTATAISGVNVALALIARRGST